MQNGATKQQRIKQKSVKGIRTIIPKLNKASRTRVHQSTRVAKKNAPSDYIRHRRRRGSVTSCKTAKLVRKDRRKTYLIKCTRSAGKLENPSVRSVLKWNIRVRPLLNLHGHTIPTRIPNTERKTLRAITRVPKLQYLVLFSQRYLDRSIAQRNAQIWGQTQVSWIWRQRRPLKRASIRQRQCNYLPPRNSV